jgi:hypothetical protein
MANLALFIRQSHNLRISTSNPGDLFFFLFYLTHLLNNAGVATRAPSPSIGLGFTYELSFLFILRAICSLPSRTATTSALLSQYPWHPPHLLVPDPSVPEIRMRFEHLSLMPLWNSESGQVGPWKT